MPKICLKHLYTYTPSQNKTIFRATLIQTILILTYFIGKNNDIYNTK
jgi:hypothetical protein